MLSAFLHNIDHEEIIKLKYRIENLVEDNLSGATSIESTTSKTQNRKSILSKRLDRITKSKKVQVLIT